MFLKYYNSKIYFFKKSLAVTDVFCCPDCGQFFLARNFVSIIYSMHKMHYKHIQSNIYLATK